MPVTNDDALLVLLWLQHLVRTRLVALDLESRSEAPAAATAAAAAVDAGRSLPPWSSLEEQARRLRQSEQRAFRTVLGALSEVLGGGSRAPAAPLSNLLRRAAAAAGAGQA